MIYTKKIQDAIKFSIETHEIDQKQKRKGKDIPYITHPLAVGLILARAGANEDVVMAGILHDTVEDSTDEKKITKEMLSERFGQNVADLVLSVTEQNKELSWEERKKEALEHIKNFSHDSLLLKSADTIANVSELLDDYEKDGDDVFTRFNAPKEQMIQHYLLLIDTIANRWSENPLANDLESLMAGIEKIKAQPTLFVAFVMNDGDRTYEIRLVNPTDVAYTRVYAMTGAFSGDDDGLLETSKAVKEKGLLAPHSSLLLERSDWDGLDFVIWYHLDLYADSSNKPLTVWFDTPKYGWGYANSRLSVIEKEGMYIKLCERMDHETIEEEVKHLDMKGGYRKSASSD